MKFKKLSQFAHKYSRYIWSIGISMAGFLISSFSYFRENHFFGYPYIGETFIGAFLFLIIFFFGSAMVKAIGAWFENVMRRLVMGALYEFWRDQSKKLIESIKRESPRNVQEPLKLHIPASPVVLDTSSIIDGRIIGVIKSGFLDGVIIVPRNVVEELQYMADKSNSIKRQKGRRGLDLLKEIKDAAGRKKFLVIDIKSKPEDVDKSLINYCKKNHARIATVDFNLNKAAQINGVAVLNINNLANEVKTNILPGEVLTVTPIQDGKESGQTLAYLEDGTMIVVKDSAEYVGKEKRVMVEKILQTSAGRMIFAAVI